MPTHVSDLLLYGTKVKGKEALFLVDAGTPGVDRNVLKTIASDRQCEVVLKGVEVSEASRLGKPSEGKEILRRINEWGALFECGYIVGLLEQVLKMAVEYAKKSIACLERMPQIEHIQTYYRKRDDHALERLNHPRVYLSMSQVDSFVDITTSRLLEIYRLLQEWKH
jgi:hypothetical protein